MKIFGLSIISSKKHDLLLEDSMKVESYKAKVYSLGNEVERLRKDFSNYLANTQVELKTLEIKDKELIAAGEDLKKCIDTSGKLSKSNKELVSKVKDLNLENIKLKKELEKKNSEIAVLKKEADYLHLQVETQAKAIKNLEIISQDYHEYKRFENEENTHKDKEEYVEDVDAVKDPVPVSDEENPEAATETKVEAKKESEKLETKPEDLEKRDPLDVWGSSTVTEPGESADTSVEEPTDVPMPDISPTESANQGKRNKKMRRKKPR